MLQEPELPYVLDILIVLKLDSAHWGYNYMLLTPSHWSLNGFPPLLKACCKSFVWAASLHGGKWEGTRHASDPWPFKRLNTRIKQPFILLDISLQTPPQLGHSCPLPEYTGEVGGYDSEVLQSSAHFCGERKTARFVNGHDEGWKWWVMASQVRCTIRINSWLDGKSLETGSCANQS